MGTGVLGTRHNLPDIFLASQRGAIEVVLRPLGEHEDVLVSAPRPVMRSRLRKRARTLPND